MAGKEVALSDELMLLKKNIILKKERIRELKEKVAFLEIQEKELTAENQEQILLVCKSDEKNLESISSSDEYRMQAENFKKQLHLMLEEHTTAVQKKQDELHKKDIMLNSLTSEILSLETFQDLKQRQLMCIEKVENDFKMIRKLNMDELQSIRTGLKVERITWDSHYDSKVSSVTTNSKKNARTYIGQELMNTQESNERLKNELLHLMEKQEMLEEQKSRLHSTKMRISLFLISP